MKKDYTDIVVVLDRSGSMYSTLESTIKGYNEFVEGQKGGVGTAKLTLVQFDDIYEMVHNGIDIKNVPEMTTETFKPRGMTALYDAIGKTVVETGNRLANMPEEERPENVIFVIITDGGENASMEYRDASIINQMINHQRTTYSWEFIFIGANQDALGTARHLGIKTMNAMTYTSNNEGSEAMFASVTDNVLRYRLNKDVESLAFTEEDRRKQEDAK